MTATDKATPNDRAATSGRVDGHEVAIALGRALREQRKTLGLTLQQLADQCGLSQPFLSQLENGKAMPSLLALHQVAEALGTSVQDLLGPATSKKVTLVRGDTARSYELGKGTTACFLVEGKGHQLEANMIEALPGSESDCALAHAGEEMIYVLEGSLSVFLRGHERVELQPGDAYTYPATLPHEWHNIANVPARFLFVTTPPSF